MTATLEEIEGQIQAGRCDEARAALARVREADDTRVGLMYLRGRLQEAEYDRAGALEHYEAVLEADPTHTGAMFRAARLWDLYGNDERAIELYERCKEQDRAPVNALINLAVLYEDYGQLDEAGVCLSSVLNETPTHFRAEHFLDSVDSTYTMVYDERRQMDRDKRNAVLDQQIGDFELSVRSRNCLKQMNIRTIGDLLMVTEAELLSYKNFGETSLSEIKALLTQKNLTLGQGLKEEGAGGQPPAAAAAAQTQVTIDDPALALRSVAELDLPVRARKCLQRLGISTLGELVQHTEAELMSIKNFGQTSLHEIKQMLGQYGLDLRSPQ